MIGGARHCVVYCAAGMCRAIVDVNANKRDWEGVKGD